MDTLLQDLRYAARVLQRSPGFTLAAVLSLALGIGANTAIFSAVDAALLRPLAVEEPGRLALVELDRGESGITPNFSHPRFVEYRGGTRAFSGMAAFSSQPFNLGTEEGAERLEGEMVSADYFQVVGVRPALGRGLVAGAAQEVVLSHELWARRFGADAGVVGRTVALNGKPFVVAGVAPESFRGLVRGGAPAVWMPLEARRIFFPPDEVYLDEPTTSWLFVVGRLAPGVSLQQAQAALAGVQRGIEARDGTAAPARERPVLREGARGYGFLLDGTARPLWLLLGVVTLVLLIACVNVANLLLARAAARRREIAVRASLGASRGRILRQLLTESLVLSAAGGAAGLLVALWTGSLLLRFPPPSGAAVRLDVGPDARVLAFTFALSLLTGVALGIVPGLRASRPELVPALKEGRGGSARLGARGVLVAAQVALAVVLVAGAGLLVRSLRNLEAIDPGYAARDVLLASIDVEGTGWEPARGQAFYGQLLERVRALPGVEAASLARTVTPNPGGMNWGGAVIPGYTPRPGESVSFDVNVVAPGWFETLEVPLRGRGFTDADREGAPPVMVINETMARRYWPNGDAVGKRIRMSPEPDAPVAEIVGVAQDGKYRSLREGPAANAWVPVLQMWRPRMTLLVRARGEPAELAAAVRREVAALDPRVPVFEVRTLRQHMGTALAPERMAATLVSAFGALALAVAAVGIFGVLAWLVVERTRELGIRMALGATRASVVRLVLGRGLALAAAGAAVGVMGAWALTRLAGSLLYGVSPTDPLAFAAATALLLGTAALASYLPAARAARVDPMVALRSE